MNDNNLFENAFNNIDDELIAEAKSPAIRIAVRRKKIIISTIAACIAAVLVSIPSIKILSDLNDNSFTNSEDSEIIPQEEITSQQSSEQASNQPQQEPENTTSKTDPPTSSQGVGSSNTSDGSFGNITIKPQDLYFANIGVNGPTTTYEEVYSPNIEHLYLNPIPTEKHVTIYEGYYEKDLDQNEAKAFADKYFSKMANALKIGLPTYEIKSNYTDQIEIVTNSLISSRQYNNLNQVGFYPLGSIILNGKPITVNQTQSDQEIISSLSDIKQILFNTFDVSFDSVKVYRVYPDDNDYGVDYLSVYFYNSSDFPPNYLSVVDYPKSDCIVIKFDNCKTMFNNIVSKTDLYNVSTIIFRSYRTKNHSPLKPIAQKEILPLEKAEEYLRKGYVLAMGGCAMCQAEQTPVYFTDYDYVSFEYRGGSEVGDLTLPYYAFYKNIGTAENGNMAFAKTYVPAVEVEGYEEYFINKHNNHNTNNNDNDYILEDNGE